MNPTDSDPKNTPRKSIDWKNCLLILGVFVTGLMLGIASQHLNRPKPHPMAGGPFPGMQKFHDGKPGPGFGKFKDHPGKDRPGFSQDREHGPRFGGGRHEASPEMKEYAEKIKAVAEPFKTKIEAVLTAEQKEKLTSMHQGPREMGNRETKGPEGEKGPGLQGKDSKGPRGHDPLMGIVMYKPALDRMSRDLALNDKQKAQVEKIMTERREAFLKFVDQNPPPAPERKHRKEA